MRIGLAPEDVEGPLDALLATGHQAVEVRAPDQAGSGAHRDGRDDVPAGHDPAVEIDLGTVADRGDDPGQLLQRGRCAVELAATVVRDDDRVGSPIDDRAGVVDRLDALDDQLPRPDLAQPRQVVEGHRRIEDLVDQLGDGPARTRQRRERERLGRQQVEPPARMERHVAQRLERQRRRDRQPVVDVAQPHATDGRVDGQHQRRVPGGLGPTDELATRRPIAPDVELEPALDVGHGLRQCLRRRRAEGRQGVRDPRPRRHTGHGRLTLVVHEPGEPGRREDERQRRRATEDRRRRIDPGDVAQDARDELDAAERVAGATQARLALGRAVRVIERRTGRVATGDPAQVGDGRRPGQPPVPG